MTLSVWRYAHLALAIISSIFLVMASVTGAILAIDAIQEKTPPLKVANFEKLSLAQTIPALKKSYQEITELNIDHNGFVSVKGTDTAGTDVDGYIDPTNGRFLAEKIEKSDFIQWITAFHRSLFLKDPGRLLIGVVSFLLMLISISGFVLVVKRQQGFRRFFSKVVKEYFSQYYHVVTGRLMLIPIFVIALTGTYLSMVKFQLVNNQIAEHATVASDNFAAKLAVKDFLIFKSTALTEVKKVEFPFADDDPEEYYKLKLNDRELVVDQLSGKVVSEVKYPNTLLLENLSLDLHTGRTSIIWAIILGIACLNILFFIYSGFAITFKRKATKISNKHKHTDAEIVMLVGSESGSTLFFANAVHQQLLAQGKLSYLAPLNQYTLYAKATHLLIFTSTYGLGEPPTSGKNFLKLINKNSQLQKVNVSVVGFGSKTYTDFCEFAKNVNTHLATKDWANLAVPLHLVDDKSPVEFVQWAKAWSNYSGITLGVTPALYAKKPTGLKKMMVLARTEVSDQEHTFMLTLAVPGRVKFSSGDLLAIYPANDHRERLYSIAKIGQYIQLVIKLHPSGLGSSYLNNLAVGQVLNARFIANEHFSIPKNKSVIMVANGTGIAPFLGMISGAQKKENIVLYAGFRNETAVIKNHKLYLEQQMSLGNLNNYTIAYSREQNRCYVMDIIKLDKAFFAKQLAEGAVLMLCGSLQMQQDVESTLNTICEEINGKSIGFYQQNGQLLSDCY